MVSTGGLKQLDWSQGSLALLLLPLAGRQVDERPVLRRPHLGHDVGLQPLFPALLQGLEGVLVFHLSNIFSELF